MTDGQLTIAVQGHIHQYQIRILAAEGYTGQHNRHGAIRRTGQHIDLFVRIGLIADFQRSFERSRCVIDCDGLHTHRQQDTDSSKYSFHTIHLSIFNFPLSIFHFSITD